MLTIGDGTNAILSGTSQLGVFNQFVGSSAATGQITAFTASPESLAASFTTGNMIGYRASAFVKGAGSTITRATNFSAEPTTVGTNNAFLADNLAYTGNYFIHQSGSTASVLGGALTIAGTLAVGTPQAYTPTNVTPDRAYDANSTTTEELADVLGTLIADLKTIGLLIS